MNGSPIGGAAAADAPLGRIAASGLGRVFLAGLVLVLAAVVVTMSGGAGLGGRLGALFGLHSNEGGKRVSALQVPAPAAASPSVASGRSRHPARSAPKVRLRKRHPAATGPQRTEAPSPRPTPAVPPPVQAPAPPPVQPPAPPKPAPSGNVQRVVATVRDTVAPVVPTPAQPVVQPVLQQAAATVDQVCGLIGGCP